MSNEETGQYIKTLCLLHQHGGKLPKDKIEKAVGKLPNLVLEKLQIDGENNYFNKRLLEETIRRNAYCSSRRRNRLKKKICKTYVKHMTKHMENEDENRDKDKYLYLKDNMFLKTFNSYLQTRKKKATEHAKDLLLKDLHKHDLAVAVAMLEQSIKNGWIGIFPLKTPLKPEIKPQTRKDHEKEMVRDPKVAALIHETLKAKISAEK